MLHKYQKWKAEYADVYKKSSQLVKHGKNHIDFELKTASARGTISGSSSKLCSSSAKRKRPLLLDITLSKICLPTWTSTAESGSSKR
uniref:Uncharacterized protein n=1 Tax=Romanomermis culicivorax TaxID=13658 RepID=A0A915HYM9_ROMCU